MRKAIIEELSPDYLLEVLEQREKEIQATVKKLEKRYISQNNQYFVCSHRYSLRLVRRSILCRSNGRRKTLRSC